MPVQNPRQLHQAWEKAYNDRDVDALLELYEPDATVFPRKHSVIPSVELSRRDLCVRAGR